MPEFYAEPMKDRKTCSVCEMTAKEKGKKVLHTCEKCHAITYCGVECQRADWGRHEWNCVPVMVTEIPGKGRGPVAARDIEKGELIFNDKPVIKLATNAKGHPVDPDFMSSLKQQINSLPTEAQSQYNKLMTREDDNVYNLNRSDLEDFKRFLANSKVFKKETSSHAVLHLNYALVNHSCAPNATNRGPQLDVVEDLNAELRAVKNICKGEEITTCYFLDVKKFGSVPKKRKTGIKKVFGFDCKCPVCLGQVRSQEKTLKKFIDLHGKVSPTPSDWKREAGLRSRIVDLSMELYIGNPCEKWKALDSLVGFAHLARDKGLVKKGMDMWRQMAEEIKFKGMQRIYEAREEDMASWSAEFNSNNAPEKEEIDAFLT